MTETLICISEANGSARGAETSTNPVEASSMQEARGKKGLFDDRSEAREEYIGLHTYFFVFMCTLADCLSPCKPAVD